MSDDFRTTMSNAKATEGSASQSRNTRAGKGVPTAAYRRIAPAARAVAQDLNGGSSRFQDGRHALNLALEFGLGFWQAVQRRHVLRNAGDPIHGTGGIAHGKGSVPDPTNRAVRADDSIFFGVAAAGLVGHGGLADSLTVVGVNGIQP